MINIKDDINNKPIRNGSKILITDYSDIDSNIAVKLSKLPYIIVNDVDKHPIGDNGDYHWEYTAILSTGEWILPQNYLIISY
jgi:hypothetical protein